MVTHFKDYYFILGILKKSSLAEIRKAYLTLAMQYHPDRNKALDAEHKFKEIKEAYDVLSDSSSRNDYDKHYQSMFLSFLTNDYKKIFEECIPFKKRFKRLDEITQTFDFNSKY
jgi:curved DNA-binding protein CbpA